MANSGKSNRGFASMDPAKQRQIASKGGQSVPPEERSFSKDPALAASAGRKGGMASHGARAQAMNAGGASSGGSAASGSGSGGDSSNSSGGRRSGRSNARPGGESGGR
jgi:general stress protein YciG